MLGFDVARDHYNALAKLRLPGRFQPFSVAGRTIILDVAHNPAAAKLLARRLSDSYPGATVTAVFAVMADKDIAGIIKPLLPLISRWYPVELSLPRAKPAVELAELLRQHGAAVAADIHSVAGSMEQLAIETGHSDVIIVFGSFFTVSDAMQWLQNKGNEVISL